MSHYFYDDPSNHGLKYNPFKALVSPRPIAWVSSKSAAGVINLAPFSFFNAVSDSPPMITLCAAPSHVAAHASRRARTCA